MTRKESSGPIDERTGIEVIEHSECVTLIQSTPLGRIGFAVNSNQVILPVNFLWYEESVVFRTLEGQKMDTAILAQPVAFEVDSWDAGNRSGWSVLVKGNAHRVNQWAEIEDLERQGLVPWSNRQWRPYWIRINPTEITGRRLV
jgi:nitroimidazol reductase NimA-like FMN-containing flavoprotein (pyridoxamine 5'-phosphate oxidase superfamily)